MDRIVLSGLEFFGRHGVFEEEAKLGARFVVDLELRLDLSAVENKLESTVDYGAVYRAVAEEVTGTRHLLIEGLANRLAIQVLQAHPLVQAVVVRVHKPHAPLPGVFRDAFVEVERTR